MAKRIKLILYLGLLKQTQNIHGICECIKTDNE